MPTASAVEQFFFPPLLYWLQYKYPRSLSSPFRRARPNSSASGRAGRGGWARWPPQRGEAEAGLLRGDKGRARGGGEACAWAWARPVRRRRGVRGCGWADRWAGLGGPGGCDVSWGRTSEMGWLTICLGNSRSEPCMGRCSWLSNWLAAVPGRLLKEATSLSLSVPVKVDAVVSRRCLPQLWSGLSRCCILLYAVAGCYGPSSWQKGVSLSLFLPVTWALHPTGTKVCLTLDSKSR